MPSVKLTLIADFKGASDQMKKALSSTNREVERLSKSLKKIDTKRLQEFGTKAKVLGAAVRATRGPLQGAIAQQRALAREIEKSIRNGMDPMAKSLKALREQYAAVTRQVSRLKQEKKDLARRTRELARRTREEARAMKEATDSAAYYARYGLMAVVAAGALLGGAMLKASAGIEDAEAAFRPMLGSLTKAEVLVGMINETAAKTPFQFQAISTSVKQLLPAVKGSMLGVIETFRMLGDVSSGNAQRLDSVTRAYTKSMLRGQVDMRSLNMIARAGVPIFSELAKSMGVTVKELFKLSRAGEISSTDLTKAFRTMTSEGGMFYRGMEIASKTLTGRLSTLRDNIMLLGVNLGNVLLPAAKEFVEVSLDIVGYLRNITKDSMVARLAVDALAASFVLVAGALATLIAVAKGAVIIETLTLAFHGLTAAMLANPFGLVIAGLAGLTVALGVVIRNWTLLQGKMEMVFDAVRTKADKFVLEMKRDFEVFSIELGEAFKNGMLYGVARVFAAINTKFATLFRMAESLGVPGAGGLADKLEKSVEDLAKKTVISKAAKKEIDQINTYFDWMLERLDKKSAETQKRIMSRLKDAKLAPGAVAGTQGVEAGGDQLSLADKVLDVPGDKLLKHQRDQIEMIKKGLQERMDIHRIASEKRIKFLRDEQARIRSMIGVSADEQALAVQAAEDLITEIMKKGAKKRVAIARRSNREMFQELLRVSVNDSQERRNMMERDAFKAHYKERMRIMQIAKEDEASFLEQEAERFQHYEKLNRDQRVRAEKVASEMILEIHRKNLEEMMKITESATSKADKRLIERLTKNNNMLATMKNKAMEGQIAMSKSTASAMQSFVSHTTTLMVDAAKTGKFAFKDMVASIATDIYKMMANKIIANFFLGLFGRQQVKTPSMTGIVGQISGTMLGSMFGGPQLAGATANIPKRATGALITRPSLNIVGEKGPEAVLPLVRRNGVLGVGAPTGGAAGSKTVVNIINNAGVEIEEEHSTNAMGEEEIKIFIRKAVHSDIRNGVFDNDFKSMGLPTRRGMGRG